MGATGGDVGGNLYASTWGDGAMGATIYDIQEIVFTKTKITNVQSISDWKEQGALAARQPGRAQMIGGFGDLLGIFDIAGQVMSTWKPQHRYLAMAAGIIGAVALKKPGLAVKEADGAFYSVAFEMKLAEGSYPGVYRGSHFREANKALEAMMKTDTKFATSIGELGIVLPRSPAGSIIGKSPNNWVWHHQVDEGIMQLVPKPQHTVGSSFWKTMHPGNKGGFAIWGK
ncbi:HNH endonuclease [Chryseobacterium sp. MEBOG06]|uniref:HNH endonuclease n=1 Tax=Chryseobacterium sp. MEBOG06 TaxID=2879938 RepID=UPI001F17103F|nr:HNH endonuclease [Chryseobacterium sp. MEBOG06]UKB85362.1 HNH endonuclease [Chryseobacterium sp. MEBOG06]